MYAVIETGGKQYRVSTEDLLKIEKLDKEVGDTAVFDKVLMIVDGDDVKIGNPYIDGAKVEAEVTAQDKHKKVIIYKYRAKKHSRRKQGHRQPYTEIKIKSIN